MRTRHETPASGPDAAVVAGQPAGKPGWLPALVKRFGSKAPEPKAAAGDADPLMAFPSETSPSPALAPKPVQAPVQAVEAAKPQAAKPSAVKPSAPKRNPQAVRLIVAGGVIIAIAVPSLGVLAVRRFPMPQSLRVWLLKRSRFGLCIGTGTHVRKSSKKPWHATPSYSLFSTRWERRANDETRAEPPSLTGE